VSTLKCKLYDIAPGVDTTALAPLTTQPHRFVRHAEFIKTEVDRLLKEGIIQESQSPWRAQCFVTNYNTKPRLVFDYSNTINRYTPLDSYPIPRIEDLLNKVGRYKYFSRIDLKSAYHQVPLKPADFKLTAFEAGGKLFEFVRLAFGLTNAVSIFQRSMDNFIEEHQLPETNAYLDDILIGGYTQEQHDSNLKKFLAAAAEFNMTFNKDKCQFSVQEIAFLGHIIGGGKLKPDPARFSSLQNYPMPTNEKELSRLLGFFAYYAKWLPNSAELIEPISRERQTINKMKGLSQKSINAIDKLKSLLIDACLAAPRPDVPLTLETDASGTALGGSLLQNGRPVAFFSRKLGPSERNQSVVEREACAIVECCRKWRHLLHMVPHFDVVTDQRAVSFLFNSQGLSKIKNEKIARWRIELSEFRFNISYRPGPLNAAADALSRCGAVRDLKNLRVLHSSLCHPGVTRMNHFVKTRNLPYSLDDVQTVIKECKACAELKPQFFKPPAGRLITATRPWERLSMDFVGPLPTSNSLKFILVVVDEFSRYPFAFACSDITSAVVIKHLSHVFSLFGSPSSIHSDRGTQFESKELSEFLLRNRVVKSRTSPYRPQGNDSVRE
jgi:hypothetical protein